MWFKRSLSSRLLVHRAGLYGVYFFAHNLSCFATLHQIAKRIAPIRPLPAHTAKGYRNVAGAIQCPVDNFFEMMCPRVEYFIIIKEERGDREWVGFSAVGCFACVGLLL